jgi:endonuclease YncB( thermonuclease family)
VFSSSVFSIACPYAEWEQTVVVQQINDGDTITLSNGKRVRFIGINTPEINYRYLNKSEPYALQAKALVEKYVRIGDPVHLVFDKTKKDKYGRILAYVYTKTGRNLSVLQLQNGFAKQWVIGNNDRFWQCLQWAEQQARRGKLGIWAAFEPLQASKLTNKNKGYHYISGEITKLSRTNKGLLFELDNKLKVWISHSNLIKFTENNIQFYEGNSLLLSGKIFFSREQLRMNLYHPVQVLH